MEHTVTNSSLRIEQAGLEGTKRGYAVMLVGEASGHAPASSAIEKTDLYQVRLDNLFDGIFFFVN